MSIYSINGDPLQAVYGINGNSLTQCYDIEGNALMGEPPTFLDSATITNIYTSSITAQPQGGCIDNDGNIYVCFNDAGKFRKYNINTGTLTEYSFTPDAYGHANGMTYNPNTGYLYLASMNSTGEVYVFDKSFNLVDTLYARDGNGNIFNCWNIAYNRNTEKFIAVSSVNGGIIYFMDNDFNYVRSVAFDASEWANTRQDIETDGQFIYGLAYNPNHIYVFDFRGNLIKDISNTAFTGEPESMCYDWTNDKYYIEGKGSYFVVREAVFKE